MKRSANASGTVMVARGGAAMEDQRTTIEHEFLERTYDPLWANALTLLDILDERGMINDGLASARIGQFVKVSGTLAVTDLTLWKGLWSLPALKEIIAESTLAGQQAAQGRVVAASVNRAERRRAQGSGKVQTAPTSVLEHQADAGLALIGMLPHTIQARLVASDGASVWCSLRDEGLVVSASDLTLKHGVTVGMSRLMLRKGKRRCPP